MQESLRQLDYAGMLTPSWGGLDRPLPLQVEGVPRSLELHGTGDHAFLVWDSTDPDWRTVEDWRGCLDAFVVLADARPEHFLAFALRFGVLRLCEHGLPVTHNPPRTATSPSVVHRGQMERFVVDQARGKFVSGGPIVGCFPLGYSEGRLCHEPLCQWRAFARNARALLRIAANLHRGKPGEPEAWRTGYELSGREAPWWKQPPEIPVAEAVAGGKFLLAAWVEEWLVLGGVRPSFQWRGTTGGDPRIQLQAPSSFGVLATQLAFAVARADGLAMCAACGVAYIPKRRPRADRRSFCPGCGKTAANRLAQRESRRRR